MAEQLDPAVEQQLADLSDQDWRSLSARVRPPTSSEQLKTIAAKHISDDQLNTLMAIANVKAFADEHGNIDEQKVTNHVNKLFGTQQPQPPRNWGQGSGAGGPAKQPGEDAKSALARRHGVKTDAEQLDAGIRPGADGRAALDRRHGVKR
jgi:hypothetical protein